MLKTNGSPGPQAIDKAWTIEYSCKCGAKKVITLGIQRNTPACQIPDFSCTNCEGLPLMTRTTPVAVELSPILRPMAMPMSKPS